ncbi:unnamed protein product, partial [Dibothriocephalus latus]
MGTSEKAKVESILSRSHSQQSRLLSPHSLDANGFDFSHKQEPPGTLNPYPSLPTNTSAAPTLEQQSYYQHHQQQLKPAPHHQHQHHHHHHHETPEEEQQQHPIRAAEPLTSDYAPHPSP